MKPKFKVGDIVESDSIPPRARWLIVGFFRRDYDYYPHVEYFYKVILLHSAYEHIKVGTVKELDAQILELSCILLNDFQEMKNDEV